MADRLSPLEELQAQLTGFIDQRAEPAMFLTSFDEELPTIVQVLDGLDGESPGDVFFVYTAAVAAPVAYVDGVLAAVVEQLAEVNVEREESGATPLASPPPGCSSHAIDPYQRLQWLFAHMTTWLPQDEGHRLVIALLPEHIANQETQARIAGTLVPFRAYPPWMQSVRLVLRDDRRAPFVVEALQRTGVKGPLLYTTRVTVGDIADAVALDAADPQFPPARRMNALLQCAALDVALGRYEAAIDKYGTLYQYYDTFKLIELKTIVVQGLGDVMARLDRLPAARGHYLQALDLASDAKSLTLILQAASAVGEVDMRLGELAEADTSFTLGAGAAEKLGNVFMRADLLERAGEARWGLGNAQGATEAWTKSATVARESDYDERLASVLVRMRDISQRAGYADLAETYAAELRDVNARLALSGRRVA
jgi:tetratricopeptide (TPR) repeat protein